MLRTSRLAFQQRRLVSHRPIRIGDIQSLRESKEEIIHHPNDGDFEKSKVLLYMSASVSLVMWILGSVSYYYNLNLVSTALYIEGSNEFTRNEWRLICLELI